MAKKEVETKVKKKQAKPTKVPVAKSKNTKASSLKEDSKKLPKNKNSSTKNSSSMKPKSTTTKKSSTKKNKKDTTIKKNVKVAPKVRKTETTKKTSTKDIVETPKKNTVKGTSPSKSKAKEKAVKKSQQANVNKKETKVKKKQEKLSENKNKKTTKKTKKVSKEKKKAIYISPSQLEKQNKRKFPWEFVLILVIFVCVGCGGFMYYQKFHGKGGEINRTNSYDTLNAVVLDQTDIVSVGSSNFKHSETNEYIKGVTKAKIMKLDTSGKLMFEKAYDSKRSSSFTSLSVVSDGYVVVGYMVGDQENRSGKQLGLIAKYDKNGEFLWEKVYESSGNVQFSKVQVIEDGYIVVGYSAVSNPKEDTIDGGALIFKYDFEGNILWQKFYGNPSKARFNSFTISDSVIYAVGKNEDDLGILVRCSMDGNIEWEKSYTYTDGAGFSDIASKDDSLFVVGSKKILPNSIENEARKTNNTDAMLLKYNLSGDIEFEKVFGGSNQDGYVSITTNRNDLFVVGYSNSFDSGLKIFTDGKKKTGILIKYDMSGDIERKAIFGGSNNDTMTSIITDNSNIYMTAVSNSKDGNILTEFDNGRDSFGKLIKVNPRLRTLFVK